MEISKRIDLLKCWLMRYFKHDAPNLRNDQELKPGIIYRNMGYYCKLRKLTDEEKKAIERQKELNMKEELMKMATSSKKIVSRDALKFMERHWATPCQFCELAKKALPCPPNIYQVDGTDLCDIFVFRVIK